VAGDNSVYIYYIHFKDFYKRQVLYDGKLSTEKKRSFVKSPTSLKEHPVQYTHTKTSFKILLTKSKFKVWLYYTEH